MTCCYSNLSPGKGLTENPTIQMGFSWLANHLCLCCLWHDLAVIVEGFLFKNLVLVLALALVLVPVTALVLALFLVLVS